MASRTAMRPPCHQSIRARGSVAGDASQLHNGSAEPSAKSADVEARDFRRRVYFARQRFFGQRFSLGVVAGGEIFPLGFKLRFET